jgi:hypothetical protein
VVVFIGTFLSNLVEGVCTFEKVIRFDMGFESFGAHERLGVIFADKSLGFGWIDKRLLNG